MYLNVKINMYSIVFLYGGKAMKFSIKNKYSNGITLIALVITIIVLLILAGISIATLTGENGILSRAANAVLRNKEGTAREEVTLAYANANMKKVQDANINLMDEVQNELIESDPDAKCLGTEEAMDIYYKEYKFTLMNGEIAGSEKIIITPVEQIKDTTPGDISKDGNGNVVSGTESSPYLICSIEDLVAFSDIVSAGEITSTDTYVKLEKSLDFKSTKSYENSARNSLTTYSLNGAVLKNHSYETNIMTSLTTGEGWEPIGGKNFDGFKGTFEGSNKEIQNIYMDYVEEEDYSDYGLFNANDGIIKNLSVSGNVKVTLNCQTEGAETYIGAIAGDNYGEINNCTSNVSVIGILEEETDIYVAGIAGYNEGHVLNCSNKGIIVAKCPKNRFLYQSYQAAGIVGWNNEGIVERCNNTGNIYTSKTYDNFVGRNSFS